MDPSMVPYTGRDTGPYPERLRMENPIGWQSVETYAPDSLPARIGRARSADESRAHDCAVELRFSLDRFELDRFGATGYLPAWAVDVFQPSALTLKALRGMLESEG